MQQIPSLNDLDAVFIDAGGVLLLPNLDEIGGFLEIDRPYSELFSTFYEAGEQRDPSREEREWLWELFADSLGGSTRALPADYEPWDHFGAAPGGGDLIRNFNERGVPVVVVSNAAGTVAQMLKTAGVCQVGAGPLPSVVAVVDSHLVGVRKPDPRIFDFARAAIETHTGQSLDLARSIHIGDMAWSDVVAATAAGITPVHLHPSKACAAHNHADVESLEQLWVELSSG